MTATPVTPHDFAEIRWRGHWIWVPEQPITPRGFMSAGVDPQAPETHGLFRKTFQVDRVPSRAPARITADSRYALFVNGQAVSRGPIRSQPRKLYYDLFDLAPFLQPGENTLAVYVKYYGTPTSYWMPAVPNLTLGATGVMVFEADLGTGNWLVSDATWKARLSDAWSSEWRQDIADPVGGGVANEVFDARRLPANWREHGFDDREWGTAQLVPAVHIGGFARTQPPTDPYGPLFPRPIAQLSGDIKTPVTVHREMLGGQVDLAIGNPVKRVEASFALPVAEAARVGQLPMSFDLAPEHTARVVLDMGVIVSGLVRFYLEAPAGTVLDLSYVEVPVTGPAGFLGSQAGTRYVARGEQDAMEVFDSNGFRYVYVLIHGVHGSVTLLDVSVREQLYPWQEGASFACDDEDLNRLFQAGVRTVQLNSHDAFIDCPTREQRAWVGDAVVHQMVHLATNRDWRLAWHYLSLGNTPRSDGMLPMSVGGDIEWGRGLTIPDWALHWLHGVWNCYRFTGDREVVKAFMPTCEQILRWYMPYQTASGLLKDVVEWNLVDWSSVLVEDTSSLLSALWARGLKDFADMAAWLGERASQQWAEQLYERVRGGFEAFWDETRGSYIDHVVSGERRPEMSQLAGALAIVSGLAPQERWGRIVDTITDDQRLVVRSWTGGDNGDYAQEKIAKQQQGIYETDWDAEQEIVIAEPFMSYVVHDAVALAGRADRLPDLYPRWLAFLVDGYDTIGECWGWGTHVHGWSCTPTRDMIFATLGVTPAEPGYTVARVAPRLGRLQWAKGTVPTPHGMLSIDVTGDVIQLRSPVPVVLELDNQPPRQLAAGEHVIAIHDRGGETY